MQQSIAAEDRRLVRLAADVGGTFTDTAAFDERTGELKLGKTLTTTNRLVEGINAGVSKAGVAYSDASLFLHGTTVVINTMLERAGAKTALIITQGFRDIYEIGRVNRPEAYNLYFQKHDPLIPRNLRFEVRERLSALGEVLTPLDEDQVRGLANQFAEIGIEAVAVLFLHSYRNPAHEIRAKAIIEEVCPDIFVTASHELSQEYREFERSSTTAANAYVGPTVRRYLREVSSHLAQADFGGSFLIVQSTGGLFDAERAQRECVRMLESGPAAGVIGTKALCERIGLKNAIAFDMGGTTAKAGVIHDGEVLLSGNMLVGGYARGLPVQVPMIHIQEVGTGGGSIAAVHRGGGIRVGPRSAGATPGPVCYGLGGSEPTVTDANLILGRLGADRFLGGEMALDRDAALAALTAKICEPLGLGVTQAADGILRIATTTMSHVVRWVTTERGLDAADFSLVAYGGAGPLHAAMVARELRIGTVIIPIAPGHFSACGMLNADMRYDFVRTWFKPLREAAFEEMEALYDGMEAEGRAAVREGAEPPQQTMFRAADMRYIGQEHAVTVDLPLELIAKRDRDGIKRHFDSVHELRYGYAAPEEGAEIVSLRSSVVGVLNHPPLQKINQGEDEPTRDAFLASRDVYFPEVGTYVKTPTVHRDRLLAGNKLQGPVLVEEYASTTVVCPGDRLEVDRYGNLIITIHRS